MLKVKVISILKLSPFHLEWVLKRSILKFIWSIKIRFQMHPMKSIYPDFMMFVEKFWLNRFPLVILAVSGPIYDLHFFLFLFFSGILCKLKYSSAADRVKLEKEKTKERKKASKKKKTWENIARVKPEGVNPREKSLQGIARR